MHLPFLKEDVLRSKKYVVSFGGLNRRGGAGEGELKNTDCISSDLLPYLSPSGEKVEYEPPEHYDDNDKAWQTVFAHDRLIYNNSKWLYYEKVQKDGTKIKNYISSAQLTGGVKQIAQVGKVTCVFPDMRCFNFNDETSELMNVTVTAPGEEKHNREWYEYWRATENSIIIYNRSGVCTTDAYNNNYYWTEPGSYADIAAGFKSGDVVTVSAFECAKGGSSNVLDKTDTVKNTVIDTVTAESNKTTITFKEKIFTKLGTNEQVGHSSVTISREMPAMQLICSYGGRLWGTDNDENTINASAYNEPEVFNRFEGLASDSYSISTQTPGKFTGCIGFSTFVCFFKENYILRVYGNRPAAFSLVETAAPGVQSGSERSLAIIGDVLYYKGTDGVYAYSGGTPVCISAALGGEQYTDAVACAYDSKYYISMKNSSGVYELFVYDTEYRIWMREGNIGFRSAAVYQDRLYYIDGADSRIKTIDRNASRDSVEWSAELCEFNETVNERKGYSRLMLRYEIDRGAYMDIEVSYDRGLYRRVKTVYGDGVYTQCIPLPPSRCDSIGIRLSGRGGCRIMNIVREFTEGSEV